MKTTAASTANNNNNKYDGYRTHPDVKVREFFFRREGVF